MAKRLSCSVITPERQVVEVEADSLVLPAHDGLLGVMKDRAPLVCEVGIGILRIKGTEGGEQKFYVDGGFAQVIDNNLTVLTTQAIPIAELDRAAAQAALDKALQMKVRDEASFDDRQKALQRARIQLSNSR